MKFSDCDYYPLPGSIIDDSFDHYKENLVSSDALIFNDSIPNSVQSGVWALGEHL